MLKILQWLSVREMLPNLGKPQRNVIAGHGYRRPARKGQGV